MRAGVLTAALIFAGFGMVIVSLFRWQVVRGEELSAKAIEQSLQSSSVSAMRGKIYDSTGTKVLARSANVWTVVLEPNYLNGRAAGRSEPNEKDEQLRHTVARGLARILGLEEEKVYEKTKENSYFSYLKRQVESDVRDEIVDFLNENEIGSGVRMIPDYKRYYPYGTVASNILGFTGSDGQGLEGLELYYDQELRGTAGRLVAAKNAVGTDMPFEYEQYNGAQDGNDLVLTLNETVQSILEKYLAEGIEKYKIKNGAVAIMMDVKTGGIVGLATKPDYDPNDPFTVLDETLLAEIAQLPQEEQDENYSDYLNRQWRNKAVSDTYYPGSVFKMCTYSMGLEENVVNENSSYTCSGNIDVEGVDDGINCWKVTGHGTESFSQGLYNSCNPWAIHLGQLLGPDAFYEYFDAFGFTRQTGVDLPGESYSIYYDADELGPAELATEAFGQNFSITPVQMITACCAVANGGYLVQPHIVDRIVDAEGNIVKTADTGYVRQVISESTSQTITSILQYNTANGTAQNGYVSGYRICGKTGTSEKMDKWNQDRSKPKEYIASYCGFAPAEDPQYALLVFFDEPDYLNNGGLNGGNAVAGPIFSKIMAEALPYLGVEANYTEEEYENLDLVSPSVTGMTLAEAYAQLDSLGLSYRVIGEKDDEQVVTQQIPGSGMALPKGGRVVLYTQGYDEAEVTVATPDFTGMSLADAVYTANINYIQISISGAVSETARVTLQDTSPGTPVKEGSVITLTFADTVETETFGLMD